MKGKLLFVAGLGVGYVLGARAGRKRYEQIAAAARKVWETPGIQSQVHQVQDFAAAQVGDIPGAIVDAGKKLVSSVASTRRGSASEEQRNTKAASAPAASQSSTKAAEKPASSGAKSSASKSSASKSSTSKASASTSSASKTSAAKKPAAKRPSGRTSNAKDGE